MLRRGLLLSVTSVCCLPRTSLSASKVQTRMSSAGEYTYK